jgi:hypothetical protein
MHFIFYLQVDIGGSAVQIEVLEEPLIKITVCLMLILRATFLANYWCGVVCRPQLHV